MPHAFILELTPSSPAAAPRDLSLYAHGLFYSLLESVSPDLSAAVHADKRAHFTLSAQLAAGGVRLRVTLLDETLFKPLLGVLLGRSLEGLPLGQDRYRVARVLATPEGDKEAGFVPWDALLCAPTTARLKLAFVTPTVFTTSRSDGKRHYTPLPIPRLVLRSLLRSFQAFSPQPYSEVHHEALVTLLEERLEIHALSLTTESYRAGKSLLTGFKGRMTLAYPEREEEVLRALGQLAALAPYCGVGAKTPYGMGQVRTL